MRRNPGQRRLSRRSTLSSYLASNPIAIPVNELSCALICPNIWIIMPWISMPWLVMPWSVCPGRAAPKPTSTPRTSIGAPITKWYRAWINAGYSRAWILVLLYLDINSCLSGHAISRVSGYQQCRTWIYHISSISEHLDTSSSRLTIHGSVGRSTNSHWRRGGGTGAADHRGQAIAGLGLAVSLDLLFEARRHQIAGHFGRFEILVAGILGQ